MNNRSRLAALMMALLLCLPCAGMAQAAYTEFSTSSYNSAVNTFLTEEEAAQAQAILNLYNTLFGCTDLEVMYNTVFTTENWALLGMMTGEQLQALYDHANNVYYALENPTELDSSNRVDITDAFVMLYNDFSLATKQQQQPAL